MLSKWLMLSLRFSRRLTVRVVLMTLLALLAVFVTPLVRPVIPEALENRLSREAVLPILTILASTMLAVTTFSLGVMVQTFQAAQSQATPRAYRVLMQDTTTQTVLATFVGAFLFSLTAIVMFRAGVYDAAASVVIFALTVLTIAAIILAILNWIGHLSKLGSMDHTLSLVESQARTPLLAACRRPALGGVPIGDDQSVPSGGKHVAATQAGYVSFIDMRRLDSAAKGADATIWLLAAPGSFVTEGRPIACVFGGDEELCETCIDCFTVETARTMDQDARFGLIVLAEIGVRALSPGVNDPGTAIDVIHRLTRLLHEAAAQDAEAIAFEHVHASAIDAGDLLQDAFDIMIRDGADRPEILTQFLSALDHLERAPDAAMRRAAKAKRHYVVAHAKAALKVGIDRDHIAAKAP